MPFLKDNGFRSLPIVPFRGNRFNILFQNAASVYYLASHLQTFLEGNAQNRLLHAVLHDLKVPAYLAGCKALGLVSFLVTVPLWQVIEDRSINIIDIGQQYQEVIDFLTRASESIEDFITGKLFVSFANQEKTKSDVIFQDLIRSSDVDDKVQTILLVMLPAMARLLSSIFADHLPGGKWGTPTQQLRDKLKGLPSHNKYSESIFGHLDHLVREKPCITTIASESYIMFTHNHTLEWLKQKDSSERAQLLHHARREVKHLRRKFKTRQAEIQAKRRTAIAEKIRLGQEAQARKLRKKEKETEDVIHWGLWQTEKQVDVMLADITSRAEQMKALKAQLNFRKTS